jgi:Holliday junction resolvasome RuvABC endonuclease subunit
MMFKLRDDDYLYRIMGVDNGSSNLGVVVMDLDLRSGEYTLLYAETFVADRMIRNHRGSLSTHTARWVRERTLQDAFADALQRWQPDAVPVENAFFQPKRVTSFEVLTEMKVLLRLALEGYDPSMDIILISPGEAKRAVQPSDFTMKKVVIRDCVLRLKQVRCKNGINLADLTEHEYDGIAVCVAHGEAIRERTGFLRAAR